MSSHPEYVQWRYPDERPRGCADYVSSSVFALAGALAPGTRVLDVGCGNGALAGVFLSRGCHVVGVDLSEPGIQIARAAHPGARFEVAAAGKELLGVLGEAPFDLVVSTEVIEHLYAPASFLEGCRDALRPEGRFIISTPYHGWLKNVLIAAAGQSDFHYRPLVQGGHIKFWSRKTLAAALTATGFTSIEFAGTGRVPYLWKSMVMAAERP